LLDRLRDRFDFQPPSQHGFDAVDSLAAMRDGRARVLFSMGGNLARALPDTNVVEQALQRCRLTVHVSTKLNRSHMWAGETSVILPTLTRTDVDRRSGGEQFVTVEDSFGTVHASRGNLAAPVESLRSEVAIVASLGERLVPHLAERWAAYLHDYAAVRADIAAVIDGFERFEQRVAAPGGFLLAHPVRDELRFTTDSGRAEFAAQPLHAGYRALEGGADDGSVVPTLILQSLRSHDQYNTTIYGHDDRYRGISGNRPVVMVNPTDLERLGLADGAMVDIHAGSNGSARTAEGFRVVAYPTPPGNAAAYYPEANVLTAIDDRSAESGTPSYKSIPVRLTPCA
jgi:molybdopterin-dependent oxidoreductase alpha subunit